jgi:small subunit ribosomal protein S16
MRGVTLGLFDEKVAMEKFESWNGEHEVLVASREETHRKAKQEKRHATIQDSVRRVEEKMAARQVSEEVPAEDAPAEDVATAEEAAPEASAEEQTEA